MEIFQVIFLTEKAAAEAIGIATAAEEEAKKLKAEKRMEVESTRAKIDEKEKMVEKKDSSRLEDEVAETSRIKAEDENVEEVMFQYFSFGGVISYYFIHT